ncbi:helix-turn-helix domain-containing protein [Ruminococcaceae bacterium OttesenSCG-928-O06]|nr:helix-turn-helix domain-containing protein [Ruminococcaceae bacterium OttesenSCG-928-O06]
METVGSRLTTLRESVHLTQKKLAEIGGMAQSTLNRYEHDQSEAPYKVLVWYADYFDVSMDYIFCRTPKPQGKLYDYKPQLIQEKAEQNEELRQFVEMCFDPASPVNSRLKEALVKMLQEGGGI